MWKLMWSPWILWYLFLQGLSSYLWMPFEVFEIMDFNICKNGCRVSICWLWHHGVWFWCTTSQCSYKDFIGLTNRFEEKLGVERFISIYKGMLVIGTIVTVRNFKELNLKRNKLIWNFLPYVILIIWIWCE